VSRGGQVGAWLELMRAGNAPTVVSNVLAGIAIGLQARLSDAPVPWGTAALLLAGTVLVYVAGMVLNDAFDARIDARERPRRPIPSGRIPAARAQFAGVAMLAVGTAMLAVASGATLWWSLLLAGCVLTYNAVHAWVPGTFVLLAVCRAIVPVIAAYGTSPGAERALLAWVAGGTFAYVLALSVVARDEMRGVGTGAARTSWILPLAACAPLGMWFSEGIAPDGAFLVTAGLGAIAVAVVSVVAGIRAIGSGRGTVPGAVGTWIGAIPAVDAATCFLLGRPLLGFLCVAMWGIAGALRPRLPAS
jgi:4-hydroxybenzoate polyprenyltransferase